MALYNVSISVKGLKYLSENSGLLPLIWTLLDGELADGTSFTAGGFYWTVECGIFGEFEEETATSSGEIIDCSIFHFLAPS